MRNSIIVTDKKLERESKRLIQIYTRVDITGRKDRRTRKLVEKRERTKRRKFSACTSTNDESRKKKEIVRMLSNTYYLYACKDSN
jgi:hypothetical protein